MKTIDLSVFYSTIQTLLLILLTLFFSPAEAWAKPVAPDKGQSSTALQVTKDTLQAKIEAINTRKGLDETIKSKVLSIYQSAQDNLGNTESFKTRIGDFTQAVKEAPEKTKKLQKEIEQLQQKTAKPKAKPAKTKAEESSKAEDNAAAAGTTNLGALLKAKMDSKK